MAVRLRWHGRPPLGAESRGPPHRLDRHGGVDRDHGVGRAHSTSAAASPQRAVSASRTWIMLVLVLVLAVVALLVMDRSAGPPVTTLPVQPLEGEPDIYMDSPVVSQYRQDGTLEYLLTAEEARHFQRDALTRLSEPSVTLYRYQAPPWSVSAREGVLRRPPPGAGEETVLLNGDVTLDYTRPNGERLRLVTRTLELYPRRQYAETNEDVMIQSEFGQTTATGLAGDLELGVLQLFSTEQAPVRTVLQPEQFK